MNPQLAWYIARATGIVAWALLAASVIWGLLLSTRLARGRPTPAWLLDLHRFLGGAAVLFTAVHLVGLVADTYVHFGLADLFVPYASAWKPGPVALGVVSLYLLAVVEGTSLATRRLPRRVWRAVHLSSYVLFWLATFHFILAGTDASHPLATVGIDLVATAVVFLTLVRILSPRGRPRRDTGADGGAGGVRSRPSTGASRTRTPRPVAGRT
ncbi:MAG: ferric reductase-like transmembrane domain-containing protein [Acidimicrobiales bacterium]|nr:ferric reductase-like transmembrane domain-containing protein [Acidimicrobiales bacterium]